MHLFLVDLVFDTIFVYSAIEEAWFGGEAEGQENRKENEKEKESEDAKEREGEELEEEDEEERVKWVIEFPHCDFVAPKDVTQPKTEVFSTQVRLFIFPPFLI